MGRHPHHAERKRPKGAAVEGPIRLIEDQKKDCILTDSIADRQFR